jgi:hypothetical protein
MGFGIPGRTVSVSHAPRRLATGAVSGLRPEIDVAFVAGDRPIEAPLGSWGAIQLGGAISACRTGRRPGLRPRGGYVQGKGSPGQVLICSTEPS